MFVGTVAKMVETSARKGCVLHLINTGVSPTHILTFALGYLMNAKGITLVIVYGHRAEMHLFLTP